MIKKVILKIKAVLLTIKEILRLAKVKLMAKFNEYTLHGKDQNCSLRISIKTMNFIKVVLIALISCIIGDSLYDYIMSLNDIDPFNIQNMSLKEI